MSGTGKEAKKRTTKKSHKSSKSRKKSNEIDDIEDLQPEEYLDAMSHSIYGYKAARFQDSSVEINRHQVQALPPLHRGEPDDNYKFKIIHDTNKYENKELQEYLNFVHKFMKEQSINASGPCLIGASGFEENALKLLEQ
jgi:hypothetical protein